MYICVVGSEREKVYIYIYIYIYVNNFFFYFLRSKRVESNYFKINRSTKRFKSF